jgi:hypothetical protein
MKLPFENLITCDTAIRQLKQVLQLLLLETLFLGITR